MLKYGYLLALVTAFSGTLWCDVRWRLVWWQSWRRAAVALVLGWLWFVVWDIALIGFEIIQPGPAHFVTGWQAWPGMPVEELLFLAYLAYLPLVIWEGYRCWKRA